LIGAGADRLYDPLECDSGAPARLGDVVSRRAGEDVEAALVLGREMRAQVADPRAPRGQTLGGSLGTLRLALELAPRGACQVELNQKRLHIGEGTPTASLVK